MTPPGSGGQPGLPDAVRGTLDDFRRALQLDLHLWSSDDGDRRVHVYPDLDDPPESPCAGSILRDVMPPTGSPLELELRDAPSGLDLVSTADLLCAEVERSYDFAEEIRFFTYELTERYEEINLLYSISETLGSILNLDEAARAILGEVCDVLGARRGSLWVYESELDRLRLVASVGEEGLEGPLDTDDPRAITARVFRAGRPLIGGRVDEAPSPHPDVDLADGESYLSVPIRYTPPAGESRTVGVINLMGHRRGDRFTASDQKLLSAIASQVGAALENNRLIRESLTQERVAREMELAHDLQMKLLPSVTSVDGMEVGARVQPAESVGGDFYHLLKLGDGRTGVMIGDVSSHGFPAALIMALSMSAATIYASEFGTPSQVLRHIDDALRDELETTEMYLTLFYAVLDRRAGEIVYANAGHPHAFVLRGDGGPQRLEATDPPVGITVDEEFHQRTVPWRPDDDVLLLFTDGLSDALSVLDRRGGEDVVVQLASDLLDRPPREIVDALFERAARSTPAIPSDDRTAVVLKG